MEKNNISLPNKENLQVSRIVELIAWALHPDGQQTFSNVYYDNNGNPLKDDEPFSLRYLVKKEINEKIREYFYSEKLLLLSPISKGFVIKKYIENTNPLNCLISFDQFEKFAKEYQVDVVVNENIDSITTSKKPEILVDDGEGKSESEQKKNIKKLAREIGEAWMKQKREEGHDPGIMDIAKYVEGELSTQNVKGPRGKFWDFETIKREALTGITGKARNGKGKNNRKLAGDSPA